MKCQLRVQFQSNIPVVGYELIPDVFFRILDSTEVSYSLEFNWYRCVNDKNIFICNVHTSKLATVQCMCCVALEIPVCDSYHCSAKCFMDSWHNHRERHHKAAAIVHNTLSRDDQASSELRSCGCWSSVGAWSSFESHKTLPVVEPWFKVGSSKTYVPVIDDVGHCLRLECVAIDRITGNPLPATTNVLTGHAIIAPLPHIRRMIEIAPLEEYGSNYLGARPSVTGAFRVLSYNVLSDIYAFGGYNNYCSSWALTWQYRSKNLLREIVGYDADILCLQEVQSDHFENFFAPELAKHGYSVIYKKKSMLLYTGKDVSEGCAIFFRRDRFKEVQKYELEYKKFAQKLVRGLQQNPSISFNRLYKDNVAVIVVLELKENSSDDTLQSKNSQLICVANTHIHANKHQTDVKLFQISTLLKMLNQMGSELHIPVLLCGDLNSLPGSAAYNLVATGKVKPNHPEMADDPLGIFQKIMLTHPLPLVSAYSYFCRPGSQQRCMDPSTNEPLFTNFTKRFRGTIDYIFHTVDSLIVDSLLELLDVESVKDTALPSPHWPSDHIALMASFRFRPPVKDLIQRPLVVQRL
ncbi:carbon catabolite repressor protein 4 homolog 1-like isoform X2 [Tasmannia lanceolata]|uniref:carbon catabolite repressor protein 4 homolog 1-like isoform X2 n=1 Tax=Tasmannia lanceolata TaxID=3420 RepID=UPI004063DF52